MVSSGLSRADDVFDSGVGLWSFRFMIMVLAIVKRWEGRSPNVTFCSALMLRSDRWVELVPMLSSMGA